MLVGFSGVARSDDLALGSIRLATAMQPVTPKSVAPTVQTPPATLTPPATDDEDSPPHRRREHVAHGHENDIVSIAHNSTLAEGQQADNVVSVLGSSSSAGTVSDSVVSVLGSTRVSAGSVGDSAVAVLGSVYVDATVGGDVVAVLGNVELGPHADVGGNLVAVGGKVVRDPAAKVHGPTQSVGIGANWSVDWLQPWIQHCLKLGRPLALVAGIGWAWTLALIALAIYLLCALIFGSAVERCVQTLETHPGASVLSALLTLIATPIVFLVLFITVVGVVAVPFLGLAVLLAQMFGKLVMLAWIGRRLVRSATPARHTVLAVLVGGVIVMALYTVPVVGFIVYKLLSIIGVGVLVYTLLLIMQGRRATRPGNVPPAQDATSTAEPDPAAAQPAPAPAPEPRKSSQVPAASAISLPRAGFWIRVVALLFDVILLGIVLHLLRDSDRFFLIILAAYGAIMWKLRGTTVGGIIFNLQVVQQDGREMEWSTASVRALSSFLSLFAIGLGFIWIAVDPENRAWHDKIAGTIVVRVP